MSKEIKEKCKECVYYNDKMEYPDVDGTTTHSNCMSIKCEYRKETKDIKIKRLNSKIADLEAKLAEKDRTEESKYQNVLELTKMCTEKDRQIEQLKQQLAEKEKELNDWKDGTIICKWTDAENKVKDLEHQLAEKEELIMFADRTIKGLVLAKEIDKISFAVEQLEKVRKTIKTLHGQKNCRIGNSYVQKKDKLYNKYIIELDILEEVLEILDNQIEELKKEMK